MTRDEILGWLREEDEAKLEELWARADAVRKEIVGDEVHLRGLIEISNYCVRQCGYCGLRADNKLTRYRMQREEIIACAQEAASYGYGTVVMQSGEEYGITTDWIAGIIREIKSLTPLAITLSLGERPDSDLECWKEAGADRYLLRFETSDPELYKLIHPDVACILSDRVRILKKLKALKYETGSGVMIGIPGQTYDVLANDIMLFTELDLDMIGVGPYISHPSTPLGKGEWTRMVDPSEQVPATELMAYKVVALTRIMCPEANIPSTSALATLNKAKGREFGLQRGANVVMPNMTPRKYRSLYEIYPSKACIDETAEECRSCMRGRIFSIGRTVGAGQGGRIRRGK
ncbi:MAG: [FeFe] hydrogenase H-cluster radical SAM maturase HydE [Planctomycetes bacterium]|nr:[FeFe] hydrogenase H-cluster radical SAM maturase HydE [Planctomycetota bacterium]